MMNDHVDNDESNRYDIICMRLMHGQASSIRDYLSEDPADRKAAGIADVLVDMLAEKLDKLTQRSAL